MGIERFIARRGTPSTILSDNSTNFVCAEKDLLACINSLNGMATFIFAHKSVARKLNPLGSPHHGGSWERLVRSMKRVLYDILGSRPVLEEVFGTTLCLVEQTTNLFLLETTCHELFFAVTSGALRPQRKGTCERSHKLTLFGLVDFANKFPH